MFAEQMNEFQKKAQARAKELEGEARKILETLGDRAQAELKTLLVQAQGASKGQVQLAGVELVKLGQRLQELAKSWEPAKKDGEAAPAADVSAESPAAPTQVN